MEVTHFINPNLNTYTACGLRAHAVINKTDNPDKVTCGNCLYTYVLKEAKANRNLSKPLENSWAVTIPEEGYYWVSDGYDMHIAYSDGQTWCNNDYEWTDFDEIYVEYYLKIVPPLKP